MKKSETSPLGGFGEGLTLLPSAMSLPRSVNRGFSTTCKPLAIISFLNLPCPVPSTSSVCSPAIFQRSKSSSRTFRTVHSSVMKLVGNYQKVPCCQRLPPTDFEVLQR